MDFLFIIIIFCFSIFANVSSIGAPHKHTHSLHLSVANIKCFVSFTTDLQNDDFRKNNQVDSLVVRRK